MKVVVIFRRFKDGGDIIALFPKLSHNNNGLCESYQHIGQHAGADYNYVIRASIPVKQHEYLPLAKELREIGYDLCIKKRKPH